MSIVVKLKIVILLLIPLTTLINFNWAQERPKDNGDVYIVRLNRVKSDEIQTTTPPITKESNDVDFNAVTELCNASFSIPIDYLVQFNTTAELPDIVDKTGMCFLRCYYEKSGLLDNWKFNVEKVRKYIWPATGDSIEVCEQQSKNEMNVCVRAYAILKCMMTRAIVDARNNPVV